jgi:predicted amidohydrolase
MGQMLVEGGQPGPNLERAAAAVARAAEQDCQAVVLPECLNFGWTHPSAREAAPAIPGPHTDSLASAARSAGVWVAAGLVERDGGRLYNSAILLNPAGEIVLKHRKINELRLAHDLYSLGISLQCADTPLGRVGLLVCADNFPDSLELGRALGRMGCRLILSPCAWAVPADHDNAAEPYGAMWRGSYTTLTAEFPLTVVGVSNVGAVDAGPWQGRKCVGCSLALGPGGAILAQGPYGEEALAIADVETGEPGLSNVSAIAASRAG